MDVSEAELLVEFVGACRNYANELAVNEATVRSYSELQHYLESGTKVLLDALRHAGDADRQFRQSQMDAAIRFCRVVFGADYAGLLAKAAEIAVQTARPSASRPARSRMMPPSHCVTARNCRAGAPIAAAMTPW